MARGYLTPWRGGSIAPGAGFGSLGGSLFDLQRRMDSLFDELFNQRGGGEPTASAGFSVPAIDVNQDDKQIEITAELPGVKEEDLDLSIENGVLTLCGEKKSEHRDEESGYSERSFGRFERRIALPSDIDEEHCSADFRDGVLRITVPKAESRQHGRRIPLGRQRSIGRQASARAQSERPPLQQVAQEPSGGARQQQGHQEEGRQGKQQR